MENKKSCHPDYVLLGVVVFLLICGIFILASVSAVFSQENFGNSTHYLYHQLLWGILPGIGLGFIAYKVNLSLFKKTSLLWLVVGLLLAFLVFIPQLRIAAGGATRWLNLGFFSLQPSEILKIAFIIYLSAWLASRAEKKKKTWRDTFVPFLAVIGIIVAIFIFQSDLSTLIVILSIAGLIYFAANTPIWHTALFFLGGVASALLLVKLEPYRMNRVAVLLDPSRDPMGIGYQIKQALIAVGSGGIFGLGPDMSSQKFGFLPQTMSDSIFAIFAEELGFVGSLFLMAAFIIFLWRGLKIFKNNSDKFAQLFSVGVVSWIIIQTFINMGAMIGIVPLSGIPLPFISYGGSHIITELVGVGILLNISKHC